MSRNRFPANFLRALGVLAAIVGLIGYAVFGWRFGGSNGTLPFILGILFAGIAIVWTLYHRL